MDSKRSGLRWLSAAVWIAVALCGATAAEAQIKQVTAGSSGNEVSLTLTNPSAEVAVDGLEVDVVEQPRWVRSLAVRSEASGPLPPGAARIYVVEFSIAPGTPDGEVGQIVLRVLSDRDVLEDLPDIPVPLAVRRGTIPEPMPRQDGEDPPAQGGPSGTSARSSRTASGGSGAPEGGGDPPPEPPVATEPGSDDARSAPDSTGDAGTGAELPSPEPRGGVPNVVGQPLETAIERIVAAGFGVSLEVGPDAPTAADAHHVASQRRADGDDVVLVVYGDVSIPGRIVPSLVGLSRARAEDLLRQNDLFADTLVEEQPRYPEQAGTVYRQYPEPGVEVPRGIGIRLWVYGSKRARRQRPGSGSQETDDPAGGGSRDGRGGERSATGSSPHRRTSEPPAVSGLGGVPHINIPTRLGEHRLSGVRYCGGDGMWVDAGTVTRLRRPPGGFRCIQGVRGVDLRYETLSVTLHWMEGGDHNRGTRGRPFARFCEEPRVTLGSGDGTNINILTVQSAEARAKATVGLVLRRTTYRRQRQEAEAVLEKLLAQLERYAEPCP